MQAAQPSARGSLTMMRRAGGTKWASQARGFQRRPHRKQTCVSWQQAWLFGTASAVPPASAGIARYVSPAHAVLTSWH